MLLGQIIVKGHPVLLIYFVHDVNDESVANTAYTAVLTLIAQSNDHVIAFRSQ
jgi:hypothetical protein